MTTLRLILRELLGLFIDDEFLAIAIIAVVLTAAGLVLIVKSPSIYIGSFLLLGCVGVLCHSVWRGGR